MDPKEGDIMDLFTRADLRELLAEHPQPRLSLFMPTHRRGAEEDPIRFRKLLGRAEGRLVETGWRSSAAGELLAPMRALLEDASFWPHQAEGLAVFLAPDFFRVRRLPVAFREEVEVGELFRVAPLLPLLQGDGRFFVLALSLNGVRLYEGTRFTFGPVNLPGVPRNLEEALRFHDRDEVLSFHTRPTSGGTWGAIFNGQGVGIDDAKDDLVRYFRGIDRGLHEVLREERAPLVLAAVDYFLPLYRQVGKYPFLLEQAVVGNPERLTEKELHERAWALVEPRFRENLHKDAALYHQAAVAGKATADLRRIVPEAYRGEVATLFAAQGRSLWGVLDPTTEEVVVHETKVPGDVDLLNFAAIHCLRHGNTVHVVPPEDMPEGETLAAIAHLPPAKHAKHG